MPVTQPKENLLERSRRRTLNALVSEVYAKLASGGAVERVEVACDDAQRRSLDPRLGRMPVEGLLARARCGISWKSKRLAVKIAVLS